MEKLKPCPFCGGKAELVEEHDNSWIRHEGCPVDMGGFVYANEAIETWNSRTLYGPYGYLVGSMALNEEVWNIQDDPEGDEEYFSLPLFATEEPPLRGHSSQLPNRVLGQRTQGSNS